MNYLIIGSGSELAKYFVVELKKNGFSVDGISVEPGDINWGYNINFLKEEIRKSNPDVIINFVGSKAPNFSEGYESNVLVTKNILDATIELNYAGKIILIGSAAEYGNQTDYSETSTEKPVSIYGLTKIMQKDLFQYYVRIYNLNCYYIRPFNLLYENIFDQNLFIGSFNKQIINIIAGNSNQLVLGNLESYRDYLLMEDFYSAVQTILSNGITGEIYNIGFGEALYIKQFVDEIVGFLNKNIEIVCSNQIPLGNIHSKVICNISKLLSLGWQPRYSIEEIPRKYFEKLLK